MQAYPFSKQPAFFPFVSAEVFFEASDTEPRKSTPKTTKAEVGALDKELDRILGLRRRGA